ncbi:MAG: type II toxin-antitoxin system prevent-host-death family antitoxin [Bifidobacteriaceae bacterium]|nr:type II toxin-antitoxin system prevent-host-death family antitoxin [Bifidobacteriaceae bacterium]
MSTKTLGSYEAKTHFSQMLDQVERGGTVTITKHGRPVAVVSPVDGAKPDGAGVVAALQRARKGVKLGASVRELIDEGRR